MRDLIPEEIYSALESHLVARGNEAHSAAWESAREDEDALTGDLGAQLRKPWTQPSVQGARLWRWRIDYKKLRGHGPHAPEHETGADGIVTLQVEHVDSGVVTTKGVLFQAKKVRLGANERLRSQANAMENLAAGGSLIFEYQEDGFRAVDSRAYLEQIRSGGRVDREHLKPLGTVLGGSFLSCNVGVRGMYYDALRHMIVLPGPGGVDVHRLPLDHRISVDVEDRPA